MWKQSKEESLENYFAGLTNDLLNYLKPFNIFDSIEEVEHKRKVLDSLTELVRQWIKEESLKKNMSPRTAATVGGNLYTFGAYRLEFHYRAEEIDVLCVAPRHIYRTEFFTYFCNLLKTQPQVKDLRADVDAYVPVIKMNFDGVYINLVFARLNLKKIPEYLDLKNDKLLGNLDVKCVRSLDGYRATEEILRLVPNINTFRFTLRVIKLWAQKHNIYSNNFGYMGDLSWAILVAQICKRYPDRLPVILINGFFAVVSHWTWPQPVLLKPLGDVRLGLPVWNTRVNVADRSHTMPIISPAYPQQNTTANISTYDKAIIMNKIKLGLAITDEVLAGNCDWGYLFRPQNFFSQYKHFIVLEATYIQGIGQSQGNSIIEKEIFNLTDSLEEHPNIVVANFNPECYNSVPLSSNNGKPLALPPGTPIPSNVNSNGIKRNEKGEVVAEACSVWFIGLVFNIKNASLDLTNITYSFEDLVLQRAKTNNVLREGMAIKMRHVRQKKLHRFVSPELLMSERAQKRNLEEDGNAGPPEKKRYVVT